jgi:hypothetical protein
MEDEPQVAGVWVLIKMIDPIGIEQGGPALDPMHFIAFGE